MKKTIKEDWKFEIKVIRDGGCRMGFEEGDTFSCMYECPSGFCPKTMSVLHSLCEAARSGGDYRLLGGSAKDTIDFTCADGVIKFRLHAIHLDDLTYQLRRVGNMDIRMIVTDLDGTFLRTDKSVSAYSQQIIRQCREKGIVFVIATARPVRAVKSFLPFFSCDAAIYHNGAVVRLGEKMLDGYGIPNPEKYIFPLLEAFPDLHVSAEIQDCLYANFNPGNIWKDILYTFTDFTDLPEAPADKILLEATSLEEMEKFKPFLTPDLYIQLSENAVAMVMNKQACKMNGVKTLAAHYHISTEEIAAFGDDYNDIRLLRECGRGIAVENAISEVKEAADEICADNDRDGVAGWLERNILL